MTGWQAAAATDIGPVRKRNEDAFLTRGEAGLWAVADGMGGHAAGDVASRLAIDALAAAVEAGLPTDPDARADRVLSALDDANAAMLDHGRRTAKDTVGSTVAAVLREDETHARLLWCGDSRIYRWRAGTLDLLTRDHTLAEQIAETDPAMAAMMARSQAAHTLTAALGVDRSPRIDAALHTVAPGDRLLICSDGLSGVLDGDALADALGHVPVTDAGARTLIDAALARGTRDNVTAVLIGIP